MELYKDKLIGRFIHGNLLAEGTKGITAPDEPLQLLTLKHKKGRIWRRHTHPDEFQESIVLKSGTLRAILTEKSGEFVHEFVMVPGDCIVVSNGGIELEALEDVEFYEFKNGPFKGDNTIFLDENTTV